MRTALGGLLATLLLAGCATVVDGTGTETVPTDTSTSGSTSASTSGSTSPSPTGTGSAPTPTFECPTVTYASAGMTFNCISNAMTVRNSTSLSGFPIRMGQRLEATTTFGMEMGAKLYEGEDTSFGSIASDIRVDQTSDGYYGPNADYDIDSVDDTTIDGHKAYTVIDTIKYSAAYVQSKKTVIRTEKRWLVLVERNDGRISAWYASIPDIGKQYWAQVPAAIASIKIND